jgi:hypothetical protein
MNDTQCRRFHDISDRMSRIHIRMLREPLYSKPRGAQKAWLKLYDELQRIGTRKDRH